MSSGEPLTCRLTWPAAPSRRRRSVPWNWRVSPGAMVPTKMTWRLASRTSIQHGPPAVTTMENGPPPTTNAAARASALVGARFATGMPGTAGAVAVAAAGAPVVGAAAAGTVVVDRADEDTA